MSFSAPVTVKCHVSGCDRAAWGIKVSAVECSGCCLEQNGKQGLVKCWSAPAKPCSETAGFHPHFSLIKPKKTCTKSLNIANECWGAGAMAEQSWMQQSLSCQISHCALIVVRDGPCSGCVAWSLHISLTHRRANRDTFYKGLNNTCATNPSFLYKTIQVRSDLTVCYYILFCIIT